MSYPYRENLEAFGDSSERWIRCSRCSHMLCRVGEDWKAVSKKRTFPPTHAGVLMQALEDGYRLEKFYCPSCGALLDSDLAEKSLGAQSSG